MHTVMTEPPYPRLDAQYEQYRIFLCLHRDVHELITEVSPVRDRTDNWDRLLTNEALLRGGHFSVKTAISIHQASRPPPCN